MEFIQLTSEDLTTLFIGSFFFDVLSVFIGMTIYGFACHFLRKIVDYFYAG